MRYGAAVVAVLFLVSACGGSDGEPTTTQLPAVTGAPTTQAAGTTPTTTNTEPADDGAVSLENCPELAEWARESVLASQAAFGGGDAGGIEFTADYFQEFADRAPREIRADMKAFANAYQGFWIELESLGFDFTDPSQMATMDQATALKLQEAAEMMATPEVERALDNIEAYFERECS